MKTGSPGILTINGGASSIKFALFQTCKPLMRKLHGKVDRIGLPDTNLTYSDPAANQPVSRNLTASDHKSAANTLVDWLETRDGFASVKAVGHRVVHGMKHTEPEIVSQELLDELHRTAPYLVRTERITTQQFLEMVNHKSGLLGVSETSSDMRDLLDHETQDVRAAEAVALFCYQAKKWIGSFAAALGGLDTLVFAGGIGENASVVRARICEGLNFLGIELNEARNAETAGVISTDASRATVRVIRTDEELMIARSVLRSCPAVTAGQGKPR